jgi:hypothetical protein
MELTCKQVRGLLLVSSLWIVGLTAGCVHAAGASTPRVEMPLIDFQDSPSGNQRRGLWVYGNDFSINPGQRVVITAMGAFDDGSSFGSRVLMGIYDRNSGRKVVGTLVKFKPGDPYRRSNRTRWQRITPVHLGPGKYTVVAANCGPSVEQGHENAYNSLSDGPVPVLRCNLMRGVFNCDGGRWLAQKSLWKGLPDAIKSWSGAREMATPPFAAASLMAGNEDSQPAVDSPVSGVREPLSAGQEDNARQPPASPPGNFDNLSLAAGTPKSSPVPVHAVPESGSRALDLMVLCSPLSLTWLGRYRRCAAGRA